jgi:S1-C subfamily serine protease
MRGRDRATGLALVKAEATGLPTLARPTQDATPVGAFVVAIGNPYGASRVRSEPFMTFGVLSARGQLDGGRTAVQTDAWINQANQGGALVDLDGRLLGITVLYNQTRFGLNSGIGFAIPISAIAPILERLQRGDRVECGYLGLRLIPYDEPGLPGVRIETVVEKSPAQLAGLRAGDRLLDVDGTTVLDAAHALYLLAGLREGDRVQVGTSRDGDSRLIAIAAGRRR